MKKSKEIYSKAFSEYRFTDEELELLHNTLFDILLVLRNT